MKNTVAELRIPFFIDCAKVFDGVRHKDLFEVLGKLDLFKKEVRIIYLLRTACIQIEKWIEQIHKNEKGAKMRLRTGFIKAILRELEFLADFIINGQNKVRRWHHVDGRHRKKNCKTSE